jgi:hypothetical protein
MPMQLGIRFSDDILAAIDAVVEREQKQRPGEKVTRSDVIRSALYASPILAPLLKQPRSK